MNSRFNGVAISSVYGVVPQQVAYFEEEKYQYNQPVASSDKLKSVMGYGEHRIAPQGVTTLDLIVKGIEALLQDGIVRSEEVDAVYFISQTPDYLLPASSAVLHGHFNFKTSTYCVDINDGCNGFVKGLFEAAAFLKATGGTCALICCGDVLSRCISTQDRNSYPLVGDGGAITVLRTTKNDTDSLSIEICYDGSGFDKLIVPAGGARLPLSESTAQLTEDADGNLRAPKHLVMNGRDVFVFTQTVVPEFVERFLTERQLTPGDLTRMYFHQANAFIIDRLRHKFKVAAEQMPDTVIRNLGNSSAATIPLSIVMDEKPAVPHKHLCVGFGVGLSWGAALVDGSHKIVTKLIEYV